jgi:hypothetical protein
MQSEVREVEGYTSVRAIVWSADCNSTTMAECHPQKMINLGRFFDFRNLRPEARRVGLNDNSNNLVVAECGGLQNKATPSEGAKRRYPAHFLSKLTDADGELQETIHWLGRATAYGYLPRQKNEDLENICALIGRKLGKMMQNPESFQ